MKIIEVMDSETSQSGESLRGVSPSLVSYHIDNKRIGDVATTKLQLLEKRQAHTTTKNQPHWLIFGENRVFYFPETVSEVRQSWALQNSINPSWYGSIGSEWDAEGALLFHWWCFAPLWTLHLVFFKFMYWVNSPACDAYRSTVYTRTPTVSHEDKLKQLQDENDTFKGTVQIMEEQIPRPSARSFFENTWTAYTQSRFWFQIYFQCFQTPIAFGIVCVITEIIQWVRNDYICRMSV